MRSAILALFSAVLLTLPAAAQQNPCPPRPVCPPDECCKKVELTPEACDRFDGFLSLQPDHRVRVVMKQWLIANQQTEEIPHQGLLIVHLHAGKLVAESGGKEKEWRAGSVWSVPAEDDLSVRTARDSVILLTFEVITD